MQKIPYGWPLLAAAVGTAVSGFAASSKVHIGFGAAWAGLSLLHAWQYRKKLKQDALCGVKRIPHPSWQRPPKTRLEMFIHSTQPAAFLPGRVRLYCRSLVGNAALEQQIIASISALPGVNSVDTSLVTGSILLNYDPLAAGKDTELAWIGEYARTHRRKGN